MSGIRIFCCFLAVLVLPLLPPGQSVLAEEASGLSVVIMDPLAEPLSCPCVQGYAQRKYERLAEYLQRETGRDVQLAFAESLAKAFEGKQNARADVIIGKDSVVRFDARKAELKVSAVARLTGKDGSTTQTGLFVVPAADPARQIDQLKGYRIFFGPADSQEKHQAAMKLLREKGVPVPEKVEISTACSDGATRVLELAPEEHAAAVISSYAQPLLEGCGTIDRGALRVVGQTEPVPFVTAFVSDDVPETERAKITAALLAVGMEPELCVALESLLGFAAIQPGLESQAAGKKN